ncbi:hypothetical protein INT46_001674 [Mucor plumbeus]|uniref:RRM domain-containing protein n=1 Tax=Mucor plumbeus TaxID=97098 RepID=A0A8H7USL6_9FUNG|nr:hypothetical protein INT46_001674 [Mucor plumbeus]
MASTRVYIGRLARDATKRDLERLFKNYGDIREINVKTGFGFVEFSDERDAKDVVYDFHGKSFLGERLIVEIARGARRNDERRNNNGNDRRRSHYRLIVENIASGTNWQDLKDMMRKAGEVTFADISRDRPTEGIVEFAVRDDMEYALKKLNDRELNGQRVTLREDTGRNGGGSNSRSSARRSRSESKSRSRSPPRRRRRSPSASRSRSPPRRRRRSPSQSRSRSASRSRSPPRKREKRDSSDREDSRDRRRVKSESRSRSRSPAKSVGSPAQSPARSPAQSPTRSEGSYPFQSLKLTAKSITAPVNQNTIKLPPPLAANDAVPAVESIMTLIDKSVIDFNIKRKKSSIPNAGLYCAYLHGSTQKKGSIVCFYPGTLYMPSEPILFILIYECSNPLAVGQYVNNGTKTHEANVCYQEIDLPVTFPNELRRLIPNMYWDAYLDPLSNQPMRVVALVALRDIQHGEELFSTYMDIV